MRRAQKSCCSAYMHSSQSSEDMPSSLTIMTATLLGRHMVQITIYADQSAHPQTHRCMLCGLDCMMAVVTQIHSRYSTTCNREKAYDLCLTMNAFRRGNISHCS